MQCFLGQNNFCHRIYYTTILLMTKKHVTSDFMLLVAVIRSCSIKKIFKKFSWSKQENTNFD